MTAINAIRFDDKSGLLVCDEQRTWNEEELKINSCDKMRPIVPDDILTATGITACYGNTGTSTLGDEWSVNMAKTITAKFQSWEKTKVPSHFLTIEDIAELAFREQTKLKHERIDLQLQSKFGFTARDYISGSVQKNGKKVELKETKILDKIPEYLTWSSRSENVTGVFLNAGIIAGYSPKDGFRIYLLSLIDPTCEPVSEIYLAEGSGLDICDHLYTDYANARSIPERRECIDRGIGTLKMLEGLNYAADLCAGVGGYIKIIYINGHESTYENRVKEISDYRSKLASEVALAYTRRFIREPDAVRLIDGILYQDRPFHDVNAELMQTVDDREAFIRYLRGYKASFAPH